MGVPLLFRFSVACVLALSAAAGVAAQQPFKSGVDLVRFDVRVVDAAGRPIPDLKPEDIEVVENGRQLPVVLFQRVTEPGESYVDAAIRAVTAEVSSNEAFPRGHLYILIFDQQHITPGSEQRARLAAEQFIRRRVRPSDRVALFAIPGPGPQIGFTSDKLRAVAELAKIRGGRERKLTTPLGEMTAYEAHQVIQGNEKVIMGLTVRMAQAAGSDVSIGGLDPSMTASRATAVAAEDPAIVRRVMLENARTIVNQTDSMSRQFLQRLADVVTGFRDIDGRKTVLLFSEGFYQDNLSRELEAVAAAAAQSYCVFYTFDLNQRSAGLGETEPAETVLGSEVQARIAPMATLAVETDGMMVVDAANRVGQALDKIADQAQDYYLVGFLPSEEARLNRGKYRRVTVKVKRSGAQVSARTGYTVGPEATTATRRRTIDTVLGAPFVQQGLRVDYTTYVMKAQEPGQHRVVLSLTTDLPVRSADHDFADVVFVARDIRDGRVVASGTDTIRLPESARAGSPLGNGAWRVQFNVPAGSYLMRTVVRDPGGLVGSADRRIDVRPLGGPDISVSDLIVGSALGGLPVRPRAYSGDGLAGLIEAYGRTPVQLEGLSVRIELRKPDGSSVASFAGDLQDPEPDGTGISRRVTFAAPLERVPSGEYLVHAIVSARGEVVAERTRQVEVLEGRAPISATADARRMAPETVSPVEITRGALGRMYIAALRKRAQGTPLEEAARHAVEGRWEGVELALKPVTVDSDVAEALRGFALFVREDYAGAAAALQRARTLDDKNALTAFFLGWAHDGAGDSRAALSAWRSAAYLDPSLVSAHLALADGYLRLAQPALALQALKAGLSAIPTSPELQARLQQIERIK
jgi:VWFA-related protein